MFNFIKDISSEIFILYAIIGLIIAIIALIVIFDKREKRKRLMNRTQELRIMDLRKTEEDYTEEFKKIREPEQEVLTVAEVENLRTEVVSTEKIVPSPEVQNERLEIDEAMYVEDDLEKTSAQLQLELLAQELEKAKAAEDAKIRKFEAEQEENAIISYNELLKVCDDLYDQNEKIQYMDEGNEPINLEELKARFQAVTKIDNNYSRSQEIELLD